MKIIILAAASAVALSSGLAMAQTVPGPKEPIPYSQLSAYMKASPKVRARKDWWSGQPAAQTGAASNTSAVSSAGAERMRQAMPTTMKAPATWKTRLPEFARPTICWLKPCSVAI